MAKRGRPKAIKAPRVMWELFEAYCEKVKATPFIVTDWVGKNGDEVDRKKEKPLTMEGFQNYLDDLDILTDVTAYFENKNGTYDDFFRVCSRIRRTIREDQISGGMAGIYNPSITQRLNSLADNVNQTVIEQPLFPKK